MLRHIPEPLHAGGLEAHVRVEAAGDGLMHDDLLLLLQQLNQLLFGVNGASDALVHVVEEADDGDLFGDGWDATGKIFEVSPIKILSKTRSQAIEDLLQIVCM